MSHESIIGFFQTLENDQGLSERLTAIEDPAEVARIAKEELGYDFTPQELTDAVASMQKSQEGGPEGELSDDQLEAVAGGWFDNWRVRVRVGW